jgi:outer membrane protein
MELPFRPAAAIWTRACFAACIGLAAAGQACAEGPTPWWLRVGAARVMFHEAVTLSAGGAVVPGLMVGLPPTTTITGTGSVAALGTIGRVKFGPASLTAQYQFTGAGSIQPYVGAGVAYSVVFKTTDGAVTNLDVDNAWGSVLQAGAEFNLTPTTGIYVDVKKIFLKTKARGNAPALGGVPVTADAKLNPLVVGAGVVYRF